MDALSNLIPFLIFIIFASAVFGLLARKKEKKKPAVNDYLKHKYLLTKNEQIFFDALKNIIPDNHFIAPKVRLVDLLNPAGSGKEKRIAFNRISQKHIDFVIFDNTSSEILYGIELDDKSHEKKSRKERDLFLNNICSRAGFILHRIKSQREYDEASLMKTIY